MGSGLRSVVLCWYCTARMPGGLSWTFCRHGTSFFGGTCCPFLYARRLAVCRPTTKSCLGKRPGHLGASLVFIGQGIVGQPFRLEISLKPFSSPSFIVTVIITIRTGQLPNVHFRAVRPCRHAAKPAAWQLSWAGFAPWASNRSSRAAIFDPLFLLFKRDAALQPPEKSQAPLSDSAFLYRKAVARSSSFITPYVMDDDTIRATYFQRRTRAISRKPSICTLVPSWCASSNDGFSKT